MMKYCFISSIKVPVFRSSCGRERRWLSHPAQLSARVRQNVFLPLQGRWVARRLNLCKVLRVGRNIQIGWMAEQVGACKKRIQRGIFWKGSRFTRATGCSLTSVWVKYAPYGVPALWSPVERGLPSSRGWHCLCSIWPRWDLSCWLYGSISVYPIKSKDHSRAPGGCRFPSSSCVVLWGGTGSFVLQESGWRSAGRQRESKRVNSYVRPRWNPFNSATYLWPSSLIRS